MVFFEQANEPRIKVDILNCDKMMLQNIDLTYFFKFSSFIPAIVSIIQLE